jgi:hypothetical protein
MIDINAVIELLETEDEKKYAERYYKWLNRMASSYDVRIPPSITFPRAVEIQKKLWSVKYDQDDERSKSSGNGN